MSKYLDLQGLEAFYAKLKETDLENKVDREEGMGLSANDFTDAHKQAVDTLAAQQQAGSSLMTSTQQEKLAGIEAGANLYTHPAHTAHEAGLYRVTVDAEGHVSAAVAVQKADLTALGLPGENTTYEAATGETAGLMSAVDKAKLDAIDPGANAYILPKATDTALGGIRVGTGLAVSDGLLSAPVMTGAGTGAGLSGLVPAPAAMDKGKFLCGDGTWQEPQNTEYAEATAQKAGLMSAGDKAKLAAFGSASDYALKSDLVNLYRYKGSVPRVADLPASGMSAGDVYDVQERGVNYAWTGTEWDALGEIFSLQTISAEDIDALFE